MQIATWNVNSLRVRLDQLLDWLDTTHIDALVVQETKLVDELFPHEALAAHGYDAICCGQKTYNGVALITRRETVRSVANPICNIPGYPDEQKRCISADVTFVNDRTIRLCGVYVPNGKEVGCEKFFYKLDWLSALTLWMRQELAKGTPIVLGGDFNIAPSDEDVWDAALFKDQILASAAERAAWQQLLHTGFTDTWSLGLHAAQTFSWWDYRGGGFQKNQGARIDHILVANALAPLVEDVRIDTNPRAQTQPSDHAPVVLNLD